LLTSPS